ncbi:hypothetical protein QCA50_015532 [Cerrena zonata]|uniref:Uncharacterized protein n=1 Tax=Cerrena zonata TaxID=2478898 RepID=A0AAW0FR85_9APHY
MPRIKLTLGDLPPGLSTRTRNKEQHPGAPDLPKPRRSHAEVLSLRNAEAQARKERKDIREDAIERAAAIEDNMETEDNEQDNRQQWRGDITYASSAAGEDEPGIESDGDSSAYQPNESGEDEIDLESDSEVLYEPPAKTQTRKKRQDSVRTAVQMARSNDTSQPGEKRKLPVEMDKSVTKSTKKTKKPEIGGLAAEWQDRRGRSAAGSSHQTGSTRGRSAASTALSSTSLPPETGADTLDDSLNLATFADEPDGEERQTMAQLEEVVGSKVRRWQAKLIPGKSKSQAPTPSVIKNRDGFKLVDQHE